ncbi:MULTISPECIES: thioesterase family protein [Bacillus]|uniref:Thioesterase n=1 Tax=Bacillus anthracis TaxID=1392 RepID=A0A2A7D2F3_BACAN|nr:MULTISPECIES: acyl-CoA thioesterase [Bacillus]MCG3425939.1 acyl-CoA thioesterase [Bacillus thuringiensis]MCP1166697.1 acyl-CoA thioesterase [Bacillus sp. 1813sda1]MDC7973072.1 acyl-CoA thioesterase [Bacillus sp. BLCC-B18]MED2795827.1 acyl-CoA thioesterase [Bacillus wiedmannii]PDZ14114.1 thioesterase [Bacillus anthracis]
MKWLETKVRVRWSEVDSQNHVYYGNYFLYFDLGREYVAEKVDLEYLTDEFDVITLETTAKYRQPAKYGDELIIRTRMKHPSSAAMSSTLGFTFQFEYQILKSQGKLLIAEGTSRHALQDKKTHKLYVRFSQEKKDKFLSVFEIYK